MWYGGVALRVPDIPGATLGRSTCVVDGSLLSLLGEVTGVELGVHLR